MLLLLQISREQHSVVLIHVSETHHNHKVNTECILLSAWGGKTGMLRSIHEHSGTQENTLPPRQHPSSKQLCT